MNPTNIILSVKALKHNVNKPCSSRVKKKFGEEEISTVVRSKKEVVVFSDAGKKIGKLCSVM